MPYSTQGPATNKKKLALSLQETLFVLSWGALAGAVFLPLSDMWYYAILPAALLAVYSLASMEISKEGSPLIALELEQYSANGEMKVLKLALFFRISLTVILFSVALIGCIPLLFGKASLPELISGIRLIATDRRLNPRHPEVINKIIRKAVVRIRTLTIVPLAAAAAIFILFYSTPSAALLQTDQTPEGLSGSEQELLTHYLELAATHPQELEYHVRLASLYHRNSMQQDLMNELTKISEIDPTHAILILADTTAFRFEMLEHVDEDSSTSLNVTIHEESVAASVQTDSTDTISSPPDSLETQPDSTELISTTDSLITTTTSTTSITQDTLPEIIPDSIPPLSPTSETEIPEETVTPVTDEIQETEEETVEPDTLVQPQ